jgi:hypothetical protein
MDYPAGAAPPPEFLKSVDQIYLLWSINSLDVTSSSLEGLEGDFDQAFDSVLQPLHEKTGKPILLGADFPLEPGQQVTAYNAILATLNSRPWVDGLISRGFYPPVTLLDSSASVYGKPAADVLWYWYPKLLSPAP